MVWRGVLSLCLFIGSCPGVSGQLPTKVDVRSLSSKSVYTYRVIESNGPFVCTASGMDGCTDCISNTIKVNIALPSREIKAIFLHEILHAAHRCASTPTSTMGDNPLHNSIYDHSNVFMDTIELNPKLMLYLQRGR